MPRIRRIVVPNLPHHITQRGARNQNVFFSSADKKNYLAILQDELSRHPIDIWSYCLMDNHVHFVAVPEREDGLSRVFREAHKRYALTVNRREGWRGHLWQERFHSYPMHERHLYAAMRYVENNPVKAGMVARAEEYAWSSAQAHVFGTEDPLLTTCYLTEEIQDWSRYLKETQTVGEFSEKEAEKRLGTGRPLGLESILRVEKQGPRRSEKVPVAGHVKDLIGNNR